MIDALEGEGGAFAARRGEGAAAEPCSIPEVAEAPSESDDFEGRRNWAGLLVVVAVLSAVALLAVGVLTWLSS